MDKVDKGFLNANRGWEGRKEDNERRGKEREVEEEKTPGTLGQAEADRRQL